MNEETAGRTAAAREAAGAEPEEEGRRPAREPAARRAVDKELARLGVTRESVLALLVEVLRADPGEFVEMSDEGEMRLRAASGEAGRAGNEGQVLRLAGPTHLLRAVNWGRYGLRVEVLDKVKSAALLGRCLGMWEGREEEGAGEFDELAQAILASARQAADQ